ncbi:uncharacterized protein LOC141686471 [Apium graveolens]|uniref:uncharacterized protein LOC141686471 n=1 Tax=Apium graveolens TaxID=4045 RepID=UPI003D793E90
MAEVVNVSATSDNTVVSNTKSGFHNTPYVSPKFDGIFFLEWTKACTMALKSQKLMKYINGKAKQPEESDAGFDDWDSENAMSYIFIDTAEKVWNSLAWTYSFSGNLAKRFEVNRKIWALVQGNQTLTQYYSEITSLRSELGHYTIFECKHAEDQEKYQKMMTDERVMKFLDGLSDEYDLIKNQLIGQVPFPTVEDAYGRVRLEESQKQSMTPATLSDRSALLTGSVQQLETEKSEQVPVALMGEKSIPQCDYCNKMYHTRENCFTLHPHLRIRGRGGRTRGSYRGVSSGRGPIRGTGRSTPFNAHHTMSECKSSTGAMTASELNIFRQLMSQLNTTPPTTHSAHASTSCHLISDKCPTSWIIDSGASAHMNGNSSFLESYHSET